jgi:hypothetical protein
MLRGPAATTVRSAIDLALEPVDPVQHAAELFADGREPVLDPRRHDLGRIVNHIHIFRIHGEGKGMKLAAVNEQLVASSGYIIPHSVIATSHGKAVITMIGAATFSSRPGGIVEIDDKTGAFTKYFGPGPARSAHDLGPNYMAVQRAVCSDSPTSDRRKAARPTWPTHSTSARNRVQAADSMSSLGAADGLLHLLS